MANQNDSGRDLPLAGIRVLDISAVIAAPVSATMLADFGAEVIKVEEPGTGDFTRRESPVVGGRTPLWAHEARNKESVTINLRSEKGQQLVHRLAARSDIVVTNFRHSTAARWHLTPDELRAGNDQLIVLAMTGYGLTGPYRDRGSFDRIAAAFSGHTYVSGYPEHPPVRAGFAVIDFMSAYLGAFAAMVALRARDQGAGGQVIDLALFEAAFRANEAALMEYGAHGRVRERVGNRNHTIVPASDTAAADGLRVSYHAGTAAIFKRLCKVMGREDLLDDRRFCSQTARIEHQDDLYGIIDDWILTMPAREAVDLLSSVDVPASVVNSVVEIFDEPHYRDRGTFEMITDEDFGALPVTAPIPRLSKTPGRIRNLGPRLGSSNEDVLGGLLGIGPEELVALEGEEVI